MSDDATLGGYLRVHERPPAFEGSDGQAYSVALYLDDERGADGLYRGALLFVRWSPSGEAPAGHVESGDLARAATPADVTATLHGLSLHRVKEELEAALARARLLGEW